jgi:acyl carrier protein
MRLVAYVVPEHGQAELSTDELRNHLRERLPEYMMPSAFVVLPGLPLTANGKLDRKALPAPPRPEAAASYVAPRTAQEELVAGIWAEVLGLERVGVHDNFFELGGHSLLATQVISRIRQTFPVNVPLRRLFEEPTVANLAEAIAQAQGIHNDEPFMDFDSADTQAPFADVDQLSDDEVEAMLNEALAEEEAIP